MHVLVIDMATLSLFLSDRRENSAISFFAWIVLGLIAGLIGNRLVNRTGHGRLRDVLLGIVGGVVGGFLANLFRDAGVTNLNVYSFFVALVGAAAFLIIYHARSIVGNVSRRRS